jgi:hypothetical protein
MVKGRKACFSCRKHVIEGEVDNDARKEGSGLIEGVEHYKEDEAINKEMDSEK